MSTVSGRGRGWCCAMEQREWALWSKRSRLPRVKVERQGGELDLYGDGKSATLLTPANAADSPAPSFHDPPFVPLSTHQHLLHHHQPPHQPGEHPPHPPRQRARNAPQ